MQDMALKWNLKDGPSGSYGQCFQYCESLCYSRISTDWLLCTHTLNLAINKCLSVAEVSALAGKCRKQVLVFKQSYMKTIALHNDEAALEIQQLQVIQDVETRWNSAL